MIRPARKTAISAAGRSSCTPGSAARLCPGSRLLAAGSFAFALTVVAADDTETYVLVCDEETSYTMRTSGTEAWVFRPEGTLRLTAVPSGKVKRYSDGDLELRIEGEQAWLGETGEELLTCRNDRRRAVWERAKLDGADFRAVGNEPGWYLEIREQSRIVLVTDYGESRVEAPLPEPTVDPETLTTRWDAGELVVEVIGRPCTDTMSGERFPSEVSVHWRSRTLRGCGRALH